MEICIFIMCHVFMDPALVLTIVIIMMKVKLLDAFLFKRVLKGAVCVSVLSFLTTIGGCCTRKLCCSPWHAPVSMAVAHGPYGTNYMAAPSVRR